jgi:hypothetical protein
VQLGAEPAQESLVEGGGASRRPTHPLVELLILPDDLGEPDDLIAELPLLAADRVADTLNEGGQQQIDEQRGSAHDQPAPPLGGGDIGCEVIGRVVELGGRDHLAAAAVADRAVDLEQFLTGEVRRQLARTLRLPNFRGNLTRQRAGELTLDRESLTDEVRHRAVHNLPEAIPDLEGDDFLAERGVIEKPVESIYRFWGERI